MRSNVSSKGLATMWGLGLVLPWAVSAEPPALATYVVELTGDALPDKLVVSLGGTAHVEVNCGGGVFAVVAQELPRLAVADLLASDLDGDGHVDLYVVSHGADVALRGDGAGYFVDATEVLGLVESGWGLSAERIDLDGLGQQELLLHNAGGDVIFWARGTAYAADAGTAASARESTLAPLVSLLAAGAADPTVFGRDVSVSAGLDAAGRPTITLRSSGDQGGLAGTDVGIGADLHGSSLSAAVPSASATSPVFTVVGGTLDATYVNDNAGEVDSADVADGSLTGGDVSTDSGSVGVGTLTPQAKLHVVAIAAAPLSGAGVGRLAVSGNSDTAGVGDAELRLARDPDAVSGMSLYYDALSSGVGEELHLYATDDGGQTYEGPYLTVERDSGEVGIGIDAPAANLHVAGQADTGTIMIAPSESAGSEDGFSQLRLVEDSDGTFGMDIFYDGENNQLEVWGTEGGNAMTYGPHMVITRNQGRVGIQTDNPQASLGVKLISGTTTIIRGLDSADQTVFRLTDTGRVICKAVEITGGGDLVEPFETVGACEPGTVVVIDQHEPGRLVASTTAYDRRVAGVVSGAGGVNPGLTLSQDGVLDGETLVALSGRVYVKCSAENGAIAPGDLLVSAALAGHAMRASEPERSLGAVIGKAMSALEGGTGLVLILVNLQ